jgi:hypothetical protein
MTTYIATRNTPSAMAAILNTRSVPRLNQGLAKTLRQAAMDNGIKQTVKGERLEFYPVDDTVFDTIKNRDDMLIAISKHDLTTQLDAVNNKEEYCGRMEYRVHERYTKELRNAMASIVVKIGMDVKADVVKRVVFTHDYAVGDWIELWGDWGHLIGTARISKVTDKSYWYELASIYSGRFSNIASAKNLFDNVTGSGTACGQEWDFTIPYQGNESAFTFGEPKMARAAGYNPNKVTAGYRSERTER